MHMNKPYKTESFNVLNSLGMVEVFVRDECCTSVILLHVLSFCVNFIFKYPLLGNINLNFKYSLLFSLN